MTTSLREKVKAITKAWADKNDGSALAAECDYGEDLVDRMTEALEAALKQGALARIERPSEAQLENHCEEILISKIEKHKATKGRLSSSDDFCSEVFSYDDLFDVGFWYRDHMRITPITADELLPSDKTVRNWIVPQNGDRDYERLQFMQYVRDFVAAKLEGK